MKLPRLGLRLQLLLTLVLPAALLSVLIGLWADRAAFGALEQQLGDRLSTLARTTAAVLEARVLYLERGDDQSRTARATRKKLAELSSTAEVDRIVVLRLADTTILADSRDRLAIGEPYARAAFDRVELAAVAEGKAVASFLFRDEGGRWFKSGYAPLSGAPGQRPAGAVVVHAAASFFDVIRELRGRLIGISGAGLFGLLALTVFASRTVTGPLSRLARAAERIGSGELGAEIPSGGPAETVVLAETMRKMASSLEARDHELQVMLSGIAHEVRNPLGGLELFSGLLAEDLGPDDPRRKHVDKIKREIRILSRVVNEFLDFARKRPLELSQFLISDVIHEVFESARPLATDRKVTLDAATPPALELRGDREALQRALYNLVQNAIQASPAGGKVRVAAERRDEWLALSVEDQGPGVPEALRAEIWKPFFTTRQQGTGLGLSLVERTVKAHRGRLTLAGGENGAGARFELALPLAGPMSTGPIASETE